MKAEILNYSIPDDPWVIATVDIDEEGEVRILGDRGISEEIRNEGVRGESGKQFTVQDGEELIRALPYQYNGSLIRARIVEG